MNEEPSAITGGSIARSDRLHIGENTTGWKEAVRIFSEEHYVQNEEDSVAVFHQTFFNRPRCNLRP
jgi:hypothetical protein